MCGWNENIAKWEYFWKISLRVEVSSDWIKDFRQELHQTFIVRPVDEAHGSVDTFVKDFMLWQDENQASNPKTYITSEDKTADQLINSRADTILKHFKFFFNVNTYYQSSGGLNFIKSSTEATIVDKI